MSMKKAEVVFVFILVALGFMLAACGGGETATSEVVTVQETVVVEVPVTQVVEVTTEVEVTRVVELEVTREVEVVVTATPPPTPVPTDTPDAPEIGTRQNPHPVGTIASAMQNGVLGFDVSIKEVIRGDEALQRIRAANPYNDPPPAGFEFVLFLTEIAYTGEDQGVLAIDKWDLSIVTDGRIIDYSDTTNYSPCCLEPDFEIELLSGGTAEGWAALPVTIDDQAPLLLIGDSSDGIYFSLTPDA